MEYYLVGSIKAAKKAADAAVISMKKGASGRDAAYHENEVARCMDALNCLRNFPDMPAGVIVSKKLLRLLRPLTKHPVEDIRSAASLLVASWRKVASDERKKAKKSGPQRQVTVTVKLYGKVLCRHNLSLPLGDYAELFGSSSSGTNNASSSEKCKSLESNLLESDSKKGFEIVDDPNDPARAKIRQLLEDALSKAAAETPYTAVRDDDDGGAGGGGGEHMPICNIASAVESVMFQKMGPFNGANRLKYRSIMFNMRDPSNPDLRRRVLLGQVNPEKLVTMSSEEMASHQRQLLNKQIRQKSLSKNHKVVAAQDYEPI